MKLYNNFKYHILKIINTIMAPLDSFFIKKEITESSKIQPIFIIGPPRSGTTLLYQLLIDNFNLAYINNLIGNFYKIPLLASKINNFFRLNNCKIKYTSKHGNTKGLTGPNEFGNFWYRWFPKDPQFADKNTLGEVEKVEIRKNINSLQKYLGEPLIFKNVVNSVRIEALLDIFPHCVFLITRRQPVYTIQSIYKIRKKLNMEKEDWWSLKPIEYDRIKNLSLIDQCVYHVYYIEKYLDRFVNGEKADQFKIINYDSLCQETNKTLKGINDFMVNNNIRMEYSGKSTQNFKNRNIQYIEESVFYQIQEQVNKLWKIQIK